MSNTVDSKLGVWRVALRGLLHFRGMLWPVALGVAAATAVIVGALLVGDSVRGSLRYLALDRLGRIEYLLLAPRFFDAATIEKWGTETTGVTQSHGTPIPAIVFPQSNIERARTSDPSVAVAHSGDALLLGVTNEFWSLGDSMPTIELAKNEIVLNQALADELAVAVGDKVTLRLPAQTAVPADSPLGKRDTETVNLPGMTIVRIIENRSLGRFDIRSNQRPSKNAFVSIETIRNALSREGQINAAILPQVDRRNIEQRVAEDGSTSNVGRALLPVQTIEGETGKSAHPTGDATASPAATTMLENLPLSMKDLGYSVQRITRKFPDPKLGEKSSDSDDSETTIFDYYQITSDQMMIPDNVVDAVRKLWPGELSTPILTYLANEIRKEPISKDEVSVTYSTMSAIDSDLLSVKSIGFAASPIEGASNLQQDQVLVNSWLAERLKVGVGDSLRIDYYLPETIDGREVEQSFSAKIAAIVPLTEPQLEYNRRRAARFSKSPTAFNDPALTPEVPGITDQASINDWDLPFPLTRTVPDADDAYWNKHRLTPKVFLPLSSGKALFGSRFGSVSSIRISSDAASSTEEIDRQLTAALRRLASELGWQVLPLRQQQIAAARGTTPFDVLFLALSFFVILAALILVSLLFRLGIERRASHWGLLLSLGWPLQRVRYLMAIEGLCLACIGSIIGCGLGILYASGVLTLLHSWWVGAVGAPFLTFFITPKSLLIGLISGITMAMLTIWIATRFLAKQPKVQLLRGRVETPIVRQPANLKSWSSIFVYGIFFAMIGITVVGLFLNGQAAGGAFVGAGMLALVGMLVEISRRLKSYRSLPNASRSNTDTATVDSRMGTSARPNIATVDGQECPSYLDGASTLNSLAASSIRRNPLRSVLAIGLVSVATLLILSMSLFEAVPDAQGTGGFQLMAESSVAIGKSLSDQAYLKEVLGDDAPTVLDATVIPMRVREGDDAGCNNLYQASQPRVLGISPRIIAYDQERAARETFAWAGSASATNDDERVSRWRLLERDGDGSQENPFPVMIDQNTALWALHLTGGIGQKFAYTFGSTEYHFVTVGLLQNTILQGSLILGEKNFGRAFSSVSGYRAWLVHVPNTENIRKTTDVLERGWADEGMDVVESEGVLQNLLAVQNTYLKAFQSLGALGLLLGTFGLAVVQLRSVMERQTEFGLLRAIGFTRTRIGRLVLLESLVLLAAGLGVGCIAAAVALVPTIFHGTIHPSFLSPAIMLGIVTIFGIIASLLAVRRAMSLKLLEALRGD